MVKLLGGMVPSDRIYQQEPSGDQRRMAFDVEAKAHNDKPLFAAALRVAVMGDEDGLAGMLWPLAGACGLVQHGGRPLSLLSRDDYEAQLPADALRDLFVRGLTYRPGFLVNSQELTSLAHVPPPQLLELPGAAGALETLPAPEELATGTPIGVCLYADQQQAVRIPNKLRNRHVHLVGRPGMGKSSLLERMVLHDLDQGWGTAVLDPHGQLVQRLLGLIPPEHAERIIYIDPGDPDWIPLWNPLSCAAGQPHSRVADDLVRAFKSFVTGWGDRLEHLLRHAIYAVLHLTGGCLWDVANLLRKNSPESKQLRGYVLHELDNEVARAFWRHDFGRYRSADLAPAQHKLSKLLTSGSVSLMLSQSNASFDLREIMESGHALLVDLSRIGPEVRQILGCFILSLLHLSALGRDVSRSTPRPFHIYCDEAHRFLTDALEDMVAETRKFNVSLTLAHQYLSQFTMRKADALSSVGSTVIFNVDTKDAHHLRSGLQGLVEVDDLITLEVGQAIARIGTHITRVRTQPPLEIPPDNAREQIIQRSRERYYRPVEQVRSEVRHRAAHWFGGAELARIEPEAMQAASADEEGDYDTW